jgi:hypothetical protein
MCASIPHSENASIAPRPRLRTDTESSTSEGAGIFCSVGPVQMHIVANHEGSKISRVPIMHKWFLPRGTTNIFAWAASFGPSLGRYMV